MWLPLIVIFSLFTAAVKVAPKIDSEPKKEWSAMNDEEKNAELKWLAYQNQQWYENGRNQFEQIPVQTKASMAKLGVMGN